MSPKQTIKLLLLKSHSGKIKNEEAMEGKEK
jgi:hypothetical protein